MAEPPIRIVIVDDDEHVRAALQEVLDDHPDLVLVGHAERADAAVTICRERRADVALIDQRIPGGGVTAVRELAARCPEVAVVALSVYSDRRHRELMLAAGAVTHVAKGAAHADLLRAIRVAAGDGSDGPR